MAELICAEFLLAMQPCEYTKMLETAESKEQISSHFETPASTGKIGFTTWPRHIKFKMGQYKLQLLEKWWSI